MGTANQRGGRFLYVEARLHWRNGAQAEACATGLRIRFSWERLQPVLLRLLSAISCVSQDREDCDITKSAQAGVPVPLKAKEPAGCLALRRLRPTTRNASSWSPGPVVGKFERM